MIDFIYAALAACVMGVVGFLAGQVVGYNDAHDALMKLLDKAMGHVREMINTGKLEEQCERMKKEKQV